MSNNSNPNAIKIMVIRHAEKPVGDYKGVTHHGNIDEESLIVQGWERAGALVPFFAPNNEMFQNKELSEPDLLYASCPGTAEGYSKSKRPLKTITPLSERINIPINQAYGKTAQVEMVKEAMTKEGVVLISWQHQLIPSIANTILGDTTTAPQSWPDDRFDIVWIFNLNSVTERYTFNQVAQNLLAGDLNTIIS